MQYDAFIGPPRAPSRFFHARDLDSGHFYAARRNSVPTGVEYERALGLIGFFRGSSAVGIRAASYLPSDYLYEILGFHYIRVPPSFEHEIQSRTRLCES